MRPIYDSELDSHFRRIPFLGQDWLCSHRRITIFSQDWSCLEQIKHSDARQDACSVRRMTFFGQDWSCCYRMSPFYDSELDSHFRRIPFLSQDWSCCYRTSPFYVRKLDSHFRRIPFLGQDWLCSRRRMTIFSQDWSCLEQMKHSDARQDALSDCGMTNLGQKRVSLRVIIALRTSDEGICYSCCGCLSADGRPSDIDRRGDCRGC